MIDTELNGPASAEEALEVLRKEAAYRLGKEYLALTAPYIKKMMTPPIRFDKEVQQKALIDCGYGTSQRVLNQYRSIVSSLTRAQRSEIFFLRANDMFFKPLVNPIG